MVLSIRQEEGTACTSVHHTCTWCSGRTNGYLGTGTVRMVVGYHVGAENRTWDVWKCSKCSTKTSLQLHDIFLTTPPKRILNIINCQVLENSKQV